MENPMFYIEGAKASFKKMIKYKILLASIVIVILLCAYTFSIVFENVVDTYNTDESDDSINQEIIGQDGWIQYYQADYRNLKYKNSNFAESGCGPTSLCIVLTHITGRSITPTDLYKMPGFENYYLPGSGFYGSIFEAGTKYFKVPYTVKQISEFDEMYSYLKKGYPVIDIQLKGIFTGGGHYIVLAYATEDGGIVVKDPNKYNAIEKPYGRGYNTRVFTKEEMTKSHGSTYWIFVPNNVNI